MQKKRGKKEKRRLTAFAESDHLDFRFFFSPRMCAEGGRGGGFLYKSSLSLSTSNVGETGVMLPTEKEEEERGGASRLLSQLRIEKRRRRTGHFLQIERYLAAEECYCFKFLC